MSDVHQTVPLLVEPSPADSLGQRVRALKLPDHAASRRGPLLWMTTLAIFALLGTGGWFGYKHWQKLATTTAAAVEPPAAAASAAMPAEAPISPASPAAPATASNDNVALVSTGYIMAARRILVSPKVNGTVVFLNADEGRQVKQGEVLAKVEDVEFQAEHDLAAAALELAKQQLAELVNGNRPEEIAQAIAELGEEDAKLAQLAADWRRKRDLRTSGVLTPAELDAAEAQYRATQKRVERLKAAVQLMKAGARQERIGAAKAEVRRREAELVKARWRLDNCTIKAPVSGTILLKNAEEGNVVDPRAMQGSYSLCELADLANIEAELMVQERDVGRVRVGQRCQVKAEAYPDRIYEGVVSRMMPIAERSKAAIPVRVKISVPPDEVGTYLKPDMTAHVTFLK